MVKQNILDKLMDLQKISAISGQEQPMVRKLMEVLPDLVDEVSFDTFGNVIALKKGSGKGPSLMIAAHTDEIGLIVKSIGKDGFIRFNKIGGMIDALLVGRKVSVNGHLGIVGVKAGHIQSPEERNTIMNYTKMYIDVGAKSKEEVLDMGINVGDPITYMSEIDFFHNKDLLSGKALDNRLGCAILWQLLEDIKDDEIAGDFYAVFTSQEEVGLRGAQVSTFAINPDYAIALDTVPAGDTPEIDTEVELNIYLGKGPVIPLTSGGGVRGNLLHPGMKKLLIETAQKHEIPVQPALFLGGTSDISTMHLVRGGILTGAVTIPRRYSHSPVEMMDINDSVNSYLLLKAIIGEMSEHNNISFLD
jgi:endoglucanase